MKERSEILKKQLNEFLLLLEEHFFLRFRETKVLVGMIRSGLVVLEVIRERQTFAEP